MKQLNRTRTVSFVVAFLAGAGLAHGAQAPAPLGPVAVGERPTGALTGKIVFVHGGHGYTANNDRDGSWTTQRPLLLGMVEDLGNKDQMDFFVDHIFRAGATVVPMRPVGDQPHEVVMDNTDPGVTFSGDWRTGLGGVYFGPADAEPYRFAHTTAAQSATAEYRPNLPVAGVWPVYTWVTAGGNRAVDQAYAIHHAGGVTKVRVDHRRVGHGLVYLGSYQFNAGSDGAVVISNASGESGSVVIADMIRFGNGRGDTDRGGGVSGHDREVESGLYWIAWHVARCQGIETDSYRQISADQSATVSAPPRYSKYMNNESEGPAKDRVFVSFHSNAGSGKARGVLGLHNGNNYATSRTPHQLLLAETLARQINEDLTAQEGHFEHDWFDRGKVVTLDRADIEFGELNNKYIDNEFDATIIETGFHDNEQDSQMLRDPRVRDAIAKAACQGLIQYFHEIDGGATPLASPPGAVATLRAKASRDGVVTLRWEAPKSGDAAGDPATGYVVYTSQDGKAFDSGRHVPGGATTCYSVAGLDPTRPYCFRVSAHNAAGESSPSEALPCLPRPAAKRVLVVDGFDRWDRHMNPTQPHYQGGQADRVRTRVDNPRNTAAITAGCLHAASAALGIDGASNEAVSSGQILLDDYDAVFWVLGEESSDDRTFDDREQELVRAYLAAGGNLFVSGADLAWDLDNLNHGRDFCREVLHIAFVADSPGAANATGAEGSVFAGVHLPLGGDSTAVSATTPDAVRAVGGAQPALMLGGGKRAAAVQHAEGEQHVVAMTIPFESIPDKSTQSEIMSAVLRYFDLAE